MTRRSLPLLALAALFAAGCGDGDKMAEVSGTISYDGKPIEGGSISFYPTDGKGPSAGGQIKDGKYAARVPIGLARVAFHGTRVIGKKKIYDTPDSPLMDVYEELLPAKYTQQSKVEFDVRPGKNEKNWELEK